MAEIIHQPSEIQPKRVIHQSGTTWAMLPSAKIPRFRSGFTLVELLVVVTLIGLIAAMAVVRLSHVSKNARREQAIARLVSADTMMRNHAIRHGRRGQLTMELGTGRIQRVHDLRKRPVTTAVGRARLARFMTPTRDVSNGRVATDYSPQGTSETYAVKLEISGISPVWILFAGATGQMARLEETADVEAVFQAIEDVRTDAD